MDILLITFVVSGLLAIVLALPMIAGKIRPNWFYGFRIKETLEDPDIWYRVNRYFGKYLLFSGIVFVVCSFVFWTIPGISIDTYAILCAGVFFVVFIFGLVKSWRYIQFLQRERDESA